MAMLCKELCRNLVAVEADAFDYGLWLPGPKYRPESEADPEPQAENGDQFGLGNDEIESPSEETPTPPPAPAVVIRQNSFDEKFTKHSGGKPNVNAHQASDMARQLGLAPSLADIQELEAAHNGQISKKDLQDWFTKLGAIHDDADQLASIFRAYDPRHTGTLTVTQMRNILGNLGEGLTSEEMNALFKDCAVSGDNVDYMAFVQSLLPQ